MAEGPASVGPSSLKGAVADPLTRFAARRNQRVDRQVLAVDRGLRRQGTRSATDVLVPATNPIQEKKPHSEQGSRSEARALRIAKARLADAVPGQRRAYLFLSSLDSGASPGEDPEQSCDRHYDQNDPYDHHLDLISFRELNRLEKDSGSRNGYLPPARGGEVAGP
jgi:hypothetical protein